QQISEESARHLLALLQKEQADNANKPDPREKMMELRMKGQEHAMDLHHQQQKHQLDLQSQVQKHQMEMAHGAQAHQLEMHKSAQQNEAEKRSQHTKLVFDHLHSSQKLKQSQELHKKRLAEPSPKPAKK